MNEIKCKGGWKNTEKFWIYENQTSALIHDW